MLARSRRLRGACALALAVAACAVLGSGCVFGGEDATLTPVSDEEYARIAEEAARSALLTSEDFPDVWEASPPDDDDDGDGETGGGGDDGIPEDVSDRCRTLFATFDNDSASEDDGLDTVTQVSSDEFTAGDTNETVQVEVEVLRSAGGSRLFEAAFDGIFETCGDDMETWLSGMFTEEVAADAEFPIEASGFETSYSEVELGDWAREWGFEVTMDAGFIRLDMTAAITFVRAGRMLGTFSHFHLGESDRVLVELLREEFAERLAAADEMLPE